MKQVDLSILKNEIHRILQQKDRRELYDTNPLDYYAVHYRRRISAIVRKACRHRTTQPQVLEIGSAQGNISLLCAEKGCRSIAIDINPAHLTYSRMKHETGDVQWVAASADALPFRAGRFDVVILGELLEHCAWPETILRKASDMLAPQGILIITTPNNSFVNSTEPSFSSVVNDRAKIEIHQFGPDGDSHLFTFSPGELRSVIAAAGLQTYSQTFIGSHFLHLRFLYRLRKSLPVLFNGFLEWSTAHIYHLNSRYCTTLFVIAGKRSRR